jgi:N-acetyltransferase
MGVLTLHHWEDLDTGLAEMRRVARRRLVLVTFDPEPLRDLWLVRDYFPVVAGLHAERVSTAGLAARLPFTGTRVIPVPHDCTDLFFAAVWARPELVLDPNVMQPMWIWNRIPETLRRRGRDRLAADLAAGAGKMAQMEPLTTRLEGSIVVLEPLTEANAEELWAAAQPPEIWDWLPDLHRRDRFDLWLELTFEAARAGTEGPFVTRGRKSGEAIGSSRFLNVRPADRVVEIGMTWLNPRAWRTGANIEAKLLMLGHAFEALECVRVEFKTDARNERSRAALAAIPARFEGVLRNHMIVPDVGQRDSAYYSVIDGEWPEVRANLRSRLER